jgi:hypothetical protein
MGAYNEVRGVLTCPSCGQQTEGDVQFKYGSAVHHRYGIGEKLVWGANDIGRPGLQTVVVDGEAGPCPNCGHAGDWPVYVFIKDDVIDRVTDANGIYDFASSGTSFLVLNDL